MRHLPHPMALAALTALLASATAHADSESFSLSTGYNESSLTSGLNRGTALQGQVSRGANLFSGSFDSRGTVTFGYGRLAHGSDMDRDISRYPVVTLFARPGEGSGIAMDLNQDWYWRGRPSRTPGKYLTLFQTRVGVVCQDGEPPKVRVTQRFATSQRRFPGRTQGVEWVWEFREDYPTQFATVGGRGDQQSVTRRTMRYEHWAFITRDLGIGLVSVNVGATHKTVNRTASDQPATGLFGTRTADGPTRVPVLMLRIAYTLRRW